MPNIHDFITFLCSIENNTINYSLFLILVNININIPNISKYCL